MIKFTIVVLLEIFVTTISIDAGVVVSKVSLLFSVLTPSSYRFADMFLGFTKDFTFRTSGPIMSSVAPAELMILSLIGSWLLDLIKNSNIYTTSEYSQLGSTHACIHQRSARVLDPGNSREN